MFQQRRIRISGGSREVAPRGLGPPEETVALAPDSSYEYGLTTCTVFRDKCPNLEANCAPTLTSVLYPLEFPDPPEVPPRFLPSLGPRGPVGPGHLHYGSRSRGEQPAASRRRRKRSVCLSSKDHSHPNRRERWV